MIMAASSAKKVFVASDHGGFAAKEHLLEALRGDYDVADLGPMSLDPTDDYPMYAERVARHVVSQPGSLGILLCRSGEGMEIAANKVVGIRAAIAWDEGIARESRHDNDSNVLSLPADLLSTEQMTKVARAWLETDFSQSPRHQRRLSEVSALEQRQTMIVAPAILVQDAQDYAREIVLVSQMGGRFQFDFIDGQFADNTTLDFADLSMPTDSQIDLDLMVARPSEWTEKIIARRPHLAVLHLECTEDLMPSIAALKSAGAGMKVGVAINPDTALDRLADLAPQLDHVLIMGVSAGFAGQTFDTRVLAKIEQAKIVAPLAEIGVDGGVNLDDLAAVATAGADIAYVNSALFGADDPVARYHEFNRQLLPRLDPQLTQTAAA